jgi:hypothetical protein
MQISLVQLHPCWREFLIVCYKQTKDFWAGHYVSFKRGNVSVSVPVRVSVCFQGASAEPLPLTFPASCFITEPESRLR